MKFRRLLYPGKTLVICSLDARFDIFAAYFLKFWHGKFAEKPDVADTRETTRPLALFTNAATVAMPRGFFRQCWFFIAHRYTTVIFLNPDHRADRGTKWAARLALVKNRAGFAPLRNFLPLNLTLPFNAENHHFVHQLKIFFEHLTGEKLANWSKPELAVEEISLEDNGPASGNHGTIVLDAAEPALPYVLPQLIKLINLVTRTQTCVITIRSSSPGAGVSYEGTAELARTVSSAMTERAIENAMPLINPTGNTLSQIVRQSAWVTGVDSELLNLAAHFEIPALALFGPLNERVWQPFATRARVITGDFACRPCTAFPGEVICTNPIAWQCVSGVSSELMLATLNAMLRRKQKG